MMFYALLAACLLLAFALMLAAARRPDSRRRAARMLAGLVAVAALWLTAYPPHRTVPVPRAEAVLLTSSYSPDTLRALLRRLGPATRVWRYAPDSIAAVAESWPTVARLGALREQQPALRRLHLLGAGLPVAAVPELGPVQLVWHAPADFYGFRAASWNRRLELGQPLLLEGFFAGATSAPVWVRLQAAGTTHDSVRLPAGRGHFRLRYMPKAAGRLVARLSAGPTSRLLATEPIPIEVLPTQPLRVLLLAATPSFELKFLRNHLAARQHAVAWRAGISRGLTQTEFSNQPAANLSPLTPALLTRYDVVVADAASLISLRGPEAQALRAAQRTTGLGLVVLADAAALPRNLPGTAGIGVVAVAGGAVGRPQRLSWPAATSAVIPATLRLPASARTLVAAASSARPVVAAQRAGAGTTVVSVVTETYPWLLQNNATAYASYWSRLLSAAARPAAPAAEWLVTDAWPRPDLPVALRLAASSVPRRAPLVSDAAGTPLARLPLRQDPQMAEWSTTTYWPTNAGWQQLQRPGLATQWLYVFGKQDWQGPEAQQRAELAKAWHTVAAAPATAAAEIAVAWPVWWFVALFVLAAGFLWLEEKL